MNYLESEKECRRLWSVYRVKENYGVTDSFDFRQKFNDFFGLKRRFLVDSVDNPRMVIPLSQNITTGVYDWFGGSTIEDNYILYSDRYKEELDSVFRGVDFKKVNESDLSSFGVLLSSCDQEITGTKIRCSVHTGPLNFSGDKHWNRRNLNRVKKYIDAHNPQWDWKKLNEALLEEIFDASINFYKLRSKQSNFINIENKNKYKKILLEPIKGVDTYAVTIFCDSCEIAKIVILYTAGVATVPILVPCINNLDLKALDYIFRYAVSHLPMATHTYIKECEIIDYQGGAHIWKTQVNQDIQIKQYKVSLKNII